MKLIFTFLLVILFIFTSFAQSESNSPEFNLGFEKVSDGKKLPDKWNVFGKGYNLKIDTTEKKSGNNSILIESPPEKTEGSLGAVSSTFPSYFIGKEIELRGFLKLKDVSDGFAGLWMRIAGTNETLQFNNMQSENLNGSKDWTQYSIKLPLPEDGEKITVGALLTGNGQVWADDFEVLIDGKDISEAKARPTVEYKAKNDKEFDNGSKITAVKLIDSKAEDLAVLAKVWGFLKYYHPAIAKGEYNWDYELFRILPKVINAKNQAERNSVLSAWVESLGTFEPGAAENIESPKIKLNPDLAWVNEKTLGAKLNEQLKRVKNAKRQNKNYYIGLFPDVGNPQFKNEDAYKSMKYPDAGYRLLSLFRYWNIIQYYDPNKHLIEENWNEVLPKFIPKFVNAGDDLAYKKAALELIGSIHDTHANIWGRDETLDKFRGLNTAPLAITFVEEKAVITKLWDQTLAEKSGLKIGDVIETINGKKVSDIVKEQLPLTPASNYSTQLRDIAKYLLNTNENSLKIKYKRGNSVNEIQLETYPKDKLKIDLGEQFHKPIPPFKLIEKDIAYLYPGSLKEGEIAKIIPEIAKTKGLIIDLRSYPSDFIVFSLGEYLLPKPANFVKFTNGSVTTPGLFTISKELTVGKETNDYYKGKVVILVNEITQSSAEYHTLAFRIAPNATVIGSTTAGADGNVSQFFLPGGISTMISGIGVYYPDGKETQRVGIVPDIVVKPTVKGVAAGRDEVLEKAIELVNSK